MWQKGINAVSVYNTVFCTDDDQKPARQSGKGNAGLGEVEGEVGERGGAERPIII